MSVFGNIWGRILGHSARTQEAQVNAAVAQNAPAAATPSLQASALASTPAPAPASEPAATVDVEAVLTSMASETKQKLDWRHSIVDLMKLVGMESSLAERKELAGELGYTGDTNDSATMNTWLHAQVMRKMAENGGTVPAELLK